MNARNIVILSLILAVLAGGLWYRKNMRHGENLVTEQSLHRFVPPALEKTVDAIEMTRPDNSTVRLQKRDGRWVIPALGDAPANSESIARMLQALAQMQGELRSSDASVLGDYGLKDDQALRLTLRAAGKVEASLLFGKGDFRDVFIRAADSPEVHVVPAAILGQIGARSPKLNPQFWIDGSLLALKGTEIKEITLHTPAAEGALHRRPTPEGNATAPAWEFSPGKGSGLAQSAMEGILPVLERVPVTEVVYPAPPEAPAPTHLLKIKTDAREYVLEGCRQDDQTFLVRLRGTSRLYRMSPSVFSRLFP